MAPSFSLGALAAWRLSPRGLAGWQVSRAFGERAYEVFPGDDSFDMAILGDHWKAGHRVVEHSSDGLGYRLVAAGHEELSRHELVRFLAQRGDILGALAQCVDKGAHFAENVSVGDDAHEALPVDDENVVKAVRVEELSKGRELVIETHGNHVVGH